MTSNDKKIINLLSRNVWVENIGQWIHKTPRHLCAEGLSLVLLLFVPAIDPRLDLLFSSVNLKIISYH